MATFKILEQATEYRIEIIGKFTGLCVRDVEASWKAALRPNLQRQLVVDISRLSGYNSTGLALLRRMHKHGTVIAASTPSSLVFLEEVTASRRSSAQLREAPAPQDSSANPIPSSRSASGNQ